MQIRIEPHPNGYTATTGKSKNICFIDLRGYAYQDSYSELSEEKQTTLLYLVQNLIASTDNIEDIVGIYNVRKIYALDEKQPIGEN